MNVAIEIATGRKVAVGDIVTSNVSGRNGDFIHGFLSTVRNEEKVLWYDRANGVVRISYANKFGIKIRCELCEGRGRVAYTQLNGAFTTGTCTDCNGQGKCDN